MSQINLNAEFIQNCIRSSEDYKQSKYIKQSVQNDEKHNFDLILDTIKKLFHDKNIQPMGQLMIIRLCKDLIDTMNLDFVEQFEQKVLLELRPFAEFKMPSQDANRGATFFDRHSDPANIDKNLKTLGTSIVRLSLDCIQAWAQFFPQDFRIKNTPSTYMKFYQELLKKGVHFPPWAYYKEDYINEHKSHDYDRIVKLIAEQQKDPQNLLQTKPLEQTPGGPALKPMTPMDPQKIKTDALAVIQQCKELSKKTSVLCSRTLVTDYQKNLFHEIYDEAYAKHMEMDQIVNNLLEIDDEELATEIMGEMDELQILIDDIKQYQQMQNYWPTFRKKYIKNQPDVAAQQQFEKEQLETAERERQRLEREKELQRIKEQEEHERQQQLLESERQKKEEQRKKEEQLRKQEELKREEQRKIEEQQRRAEQEHKDKLEQQRLLDQQREEHQRQELLKQQNQVNQHPQLPEIYAQQQADENSYKSAKFQQEPDVIDQYKSIVQSNIQAPQSLVNPNFQYSQKPISNKQKRERSPFGIQKHQGDSHQAIPEFKPPESYGVQSMAMKGEGENLQLNMNNDLVDLLKQQLAQKSQDYDRLFEENQRLKTQSQTDKDKIEQYHQEIIRLSNQVSTIAAQHGQLNQQLSSSINNQEYDNLLQKLENERNNTRKAELKNNELKSTQDKLEIQIKVLQDQLKIQQSQHDMFKQNILGETQKSSQADASQLQKKINEHVIEKEQLKSQLEKNQDVQTKHAMALQKLNLVTRELEEISKEKQKVTQTHNEALDQHKFHVGEKQKQIDSLTDQLSVLKLKYDKLFKDYESLADKHKKTKEELHGKVLDAKKECLQKQASVDQIQLQLSDKDDELKHAQIELNALHVEKTQLQRNNEAQSLQIKQYMNLLNNSNQSQQVKSIPLYQQKLQKALDDMDQLREQHKKEILELSAQKQQIIDDLALKNEQLQFLNQQSHKQQEVQQELVIAPPQSAFMQPSVNSNFESNVQNSQQVCPLPLFKHFPFNQHHSIPQYTEQQQELTLECLDMIFPYNDPIDYYNSKAMKNRKGNVVSTSSFQIEIAHMDNLNKSLYRQRGLGSNGVLFQNNEIKIGLLFQIQQKNSKQYFTYGIYLTSLTTQNIQLQFLETENIESFWAEPLQLRKQLKPQEQQLIEVIAGSTQDIVCQLTTLGHPYQFLIPNNICQLITYQDVKKTDFQQRWKQLLSQQQRTEILLLNKDVFQSVDQFLKMVPRLFIINSHKEQDYKMGIDELKIGGLGTCQYQPFWIKFEFIPNDKICIYLTYESRYQKNKNTYDKILQSYAQLLSDGKTK